MKTLNLTNVSHTLAEFSTDNIPVGQVFRGEMVMRDGSVFPGVFYKAHGRYAEPVNGLTVNRAPVRVPRDCVIVRLDGPGHPGRANLINTAHIVRYYEPLDATVFLTRP